jgi:DNA-binding NtrC family response regulator
MTVLDVLVVAPETNERAAILRLLSAAGHHVAAVDTTAAAQPKLTRRGLVIVDLALGSDALRLIRALSGHKSFVPVLALTDRRLPDASTEALRLGVAGILARPVRERDLMAAVANANEYARLASAPVEPAGSGPEDGVFGHSPAMRSVIDLVRRVGHSGCSVLIVGERGTGREMVARAIHAQRRGDRDFVPIDCAAGVSSNGARPETAALEKELLDLLAQPAAPPAEAARPQKLSPTVFLKNIDEMPEAVQAALERMLVDREAGTRPEELFPRLIASATPTIEETVNGGQFRRELFDRVAVVRIDLPRLRQRRQDIPLLATHFLKEACERQGAPVKSFTRSALTLLAALPWEGNARELRTLTERLAVLVPRGLVLLEDVIEHVRFDGVEARGGPRGSLREARERFERDFVASVLQHHRGRMGPAAKELGIERTNLYRKIKQLNIRWAPPAPRQRQH